MREDLRHGRSYRSSVPVMVGAQLEHKFRDALHPGNISG
ncbi:hypothetical protein THTE_2107 [Thermogutta terrifontis]|uniref:Uncharacterized protein n=1 Tax=Thermogutta terrifontis TaxID=1331910 RepID=A0A286RFH0_9BACT|nr:hypothetical protein THTE_2107 [Thermogutta terrifontis]